MLKLINSILEIVLSAGVESLFIMLIVLGFNWKSLAKGKLFITFTLLSVFLWICQLATFRIPVISQLFIILGTSFILYTILNIDFKKCIVNICVLVFMIMLPSEVLWFIILKTFVNFDISNALDIVQKFKYGIGVRIFELPLIYFYTKGVFETWVYFGFLQKKKMKK